MPATAQRCVNVNAFRPDIKELQCFADKHRNVKNPGLGIRNSGFACSGFALLIVLAHSISIPTSNSEREAKLAGQRTAWRKPLQPVSLQIESRKPRERSNSRHAFFSPYSEFPNIRFPNCPTRPWPTRGTGWSWARGDVPNSKLPGTLPGGRLRQLRRAFLPIPEEATESRHRSEEHTSE